MAETSIRNKRAVMWMLFDNAGIDRHLPGVVTSMQSVIDNKGASAFDMVVMVTPGVAESSRRIIEAMGGIVVQVDEVPLDVTSMEISKNQLVQNYDVLFTRVCTKFRALGLVQYEKIVFLDSDTLVAASLDPVFALNTPAAPFNTPWLFTEEPYHTGGDPYYPRAIKNARTPMEHGGHVTDNHVAHILNHTAPQITASCMVLEPNIADMQNLIASRYALTDNMFSKCKNGPEELLMMAYYKNWTNVHYSYNYTPWKWTGALATTTRIAHYILGVKPWDADAKPWDDLRPWFLTLDRALATINSRGVFARPLLREDLHVYNGAMDEFAGIPALMNDAKGLFDAAGVKLNAQ